MSGRKILDPTTYIPISAYTVKSASWGWTACLFEICKGRFQSKIHKESASCWSYNVINALLNTHTTSKDSSERMGSPSQRPLPTQQTQQTNSLRLDSKSAIPAIKQFANLNPRKHDNWSHGCWKSSFANWSRYCPLLMVYIFRDCLLRVMMSDVDIQTGLFCYT